MSISSPGTWNVQGQGSTLSLWCPSACLVKDLHAVGGQEICTEWRNVLEVECSCSPPHTSRSISSFTSGTLNIVSPPAWWQATALAKEKEEKDSEKPKMCFEAWPVLRLLGAFPRVISFHPKHRPREPYNYGSPFHLWEKWDSAWPRSWWNPNSSSELYVSFASYDSSASSSWNEYLYSESRLSLLSSIFVHFHHCTEIPEAG